MEMLQLVGHELSKTIQIKDKWYTFKSKVAGVTLSESNLKKLYSNNQIKPIAVHGDLPSATDFAKQRSIMGRHKHDKK